MLWKFKYLSHATEERRIISVISAILLQTVEDLKTRGQKIRLFQVCFIFFTRSYTSKKLCEISILCSNLCKSILDGMCNRFQEIIKTEWTTFLDAPGGTGEVMQGAQVRGCPFNARSENKHPFGLIVDAILKSNANNKKYFKNKQHNIKVMIHSKGCLRLI